MDAFAALSVLANLQHLCVVEEDEGDMCELPGMVWSSVQQLTHLKLSWVKVTAEDLCHISSMSRLCALELYGDARLTRDAVPGGFALPPLLRHLTFDAELESSFLATATQLTHLNLSGAIIEGEGDALAGSCLLEALATLQHLDTLCLSWLDVNWPPASLVYQAVMASSSLRSLTVDHCSLPDGVLAYIFPLEQQHLVRTCLEELTVRSAAPLDTRVFSRLVGVCPSLQQLNVSLADGPYLNELSKLTSLTELFLQSSSTACVQYVASLTRLQDLSLLLDLPGRAGWPVLLDLTALRQLTRLLSCTATLEAPAFLFTKAGPGEPPDVWLQLLERCAADSPQCQLSITRSLAQQLAEQQQAVTGLRQQLAEQQQEGSHMRQQLVQQQRQNDVLQQEVAAQAAQLHALHSQLQAVLQRL